MAEEKTRYWLKLDKGFLKSSQIKVIKNIPNGKDYIIFYLSLMLESVETVGHLRFSEFVPYNEEMLASITDTNIDIVRSAVKLFTDLGLMRTLTDGTIFMPEVPKLTGKESESAERVRLFRQRKLLESNGANNEALQCNVEVTNSNDNIYIQTNKQLKEEIEIHTDMCEKNEITDIDGINQVLEIYPKREGNNSPQPIRRAVSASIMKSHSIIAILEGTRRYVDYIKQKGWENTQYVMNGAKFFQDECFLQDWKISDKKPGHKKSGLELAQELLQAQALQTFNQPATATMELQNDTNNR